MSRPLYILGGALFVLAAVSFGLMFSTGPFQIGMPGSGSAWKVIALFLFFLSLLSVFAGVMANMFEQVGRRAAERERAQGKRR
jgi:hypothetical protein